MWPVEYRAHAFRATGTSRLRSEDNSVNPLPPLPPELTSEIISYAVENAVPTVPCNAKGRAQLIESLKGICRLRQNNDDTRACIRKHVQEHTRKCSIYVTVTLSISVTGFKTSDPQTIDWTKMTDDDPEAVVPYIPMDDADAGAWFLKRTSGNSTSFLWFHIIPEDNVNPMTLEDIRHDHDTTLPSVDSASRTLTLHIEHQGRRFDLWAPFGTYDDDIGTGGGNFHLKDVSNNVSVPMVDEKYQDALKRLRGTLECMGTVEARLNDEVLDENGRFYNRRNDSLILLSFEALQATHDYTPADVFRVLLGYG